MRVSKHKPYDPVSIATERISLKSPVPRLQWDHRPYEPLVMRPEEVWPKKRVCLIDTEPYPLPPGEKPNWWEWVVDFTFGLYQRPNASVLMALDSLQSGASTLVDKVPSLKDPAKGGRLNLENLRVHMLTNEMVDELCRAYHEWPFKTKGAAHPRYFSTLFGSRGIKGLQARSGATGKDQ